MRPVKGSPPPQPPDLAQSYTWSPTPFFHQYIVVVTKKPPMCQIMCFPLYCLNRSIEGRHIDYKNSYVHNSRFYRQKCYYSNLLCADQPQKPPM